jgi:hypothetical protein
MQYEYLGMYINHKLMCPSCHEAFLALETNLPHAIELCLSSFSLYSNEYLYNNVELGLCNVHLNIEFTNNLYKEYFIF